MQGNHAPAGWIPPAESPRPPAAMSNDAPADDRTPLRILLDDEPFATLIEIAEACHAEPRAVAAALLTDLLLDDAKAHQIHAGVPRERLN